MREAPHSTLLTAQYEARPLRLAWVLDDDLNSVTRLMEANVALWGGLYNPIVPVGSEAYSQSEAAALVAKFDPDYIIFLDSQEPIQQRDRGPHIIDGRQRSISGILEDIDPISTLPILDAAIRDDQRLMSVDPTDSGGLATSAFWGTYVQGSIHERHLSASRRVVRLRYPKAEHILDDVHLVTLASRQLAYNRPLTVDHHSFIVVVLDETRLRSVVEFWNYRGLSSGIVIPVSAARYPRYEATVEAIVPRAEHHFKYDTVQRVEYWIRLVSDGCAADAIAAITKWLRSGGVTSEVSTSLLRDMLWCQRSSWPVALTTRVSAFVQDGDLQFVGERPGIASMASGRFAGELGVSAAGGRIFCVATPDGGGPVRTHRHPPEWPVLRTTNSSVVFLHSSQSVHGYMRGLTIPDAIVRLLGAERIASIESSPASRTTQKVIDALGGLDKCGLLGEVGVRTLLSALERGGRLESTEVQRILGRSLPQAGSPKWRNDVTQRLMDDLVKQRVLRSGLELTCAECGQPAWYHLGSFADTFACQWCFAVNRTPRVDNRKWSFRSDGLYQLRGSMEGSIANVLGMAFFHRIAKVKIGWSAYVHGPFSVADSANGPGCEVDFATLVVGPFAGRTRVVWGEAKSHNELEERDAERMRRLVGRGEYAAFITLKDHWTQREQELLRGLRTNGVKMVLLRSQHLAKNDMHLSWMIDLCQGMQYDWLDGLSKRTTDYLDGDDFV